MTELANELVSGSASGCFGERGVKSRLNNPALCSGRLEISGQADAALLPDGTIATSWQEREVHRRST